ncbi:hypothetical protein D3C85_1474760 [compost metagenome]
MSGCIKNNPLANRTTRKITAATASSNTKTVPLFGELPRKAGNFSNVVCHPRIDHHFRSNRQKTCIRRECGSNIRLSTYFTRDVLVQILCDFTHIPLYLILLDLMIAQATYLFSSHVVPLIRKAERIRSLRVVNYLNIHRLARLQATNR